MGGERMSEIEVTRENIESDIVLEGESVTYANLPAITGEDDGKGIFAEGGAWVKKYPLPVVSAADKGKVLRTDGETWGADSLADIIGDGEAKVMSQLPRYAGFITSQGKWDYCNTSSYKYICIAVNGGESLSLSSQASRPVYYSALKTYSTPSNGDDAVFSEEAGWTGRRQVNSNKSYTTVLPEDARYLVITTLNNSNDSSPVRFVLGGYELTATGIADALKKYTETEVDNLLTSSGAKIIDMFSVDGVVAPIVWELGSVSANNGIGYPVPDFATNTRWRGKGILKFAEPLKVTCDSDYYYNVFLLDEDGNLEAKAFNTLTSQSYTIPAKTPFRIVCGKKDNSDVSEVTITDYISVKYMLFAEMVDERYNPGVKWCAMGDSITEGYHSEIGGGSSEVDSAHCWATRVSEINKWNLTNIGKGGSGFLCKGGTKNPIAGYEIARNTDFSGYNLISIMYGINDWKADEEVGEIGEIVETPTTVIQAMQIVIEEILTDNPICKIIGILPINCAGYSKDYGDEESNWGLGHRFTNSGTLEEFVQALISVYDYYGIQYVDMAHYSCVNRKNLLTALPDGVHPANATHEIMARELSQKITFA